MRVARRIVHALLLVLTLIVGATAAAIIVTQTAWFKNWLRGYIVAEANTYLNGQLSVQRLGGNLFFGVELENIGISLDGSEVVAVEDLGLDYNVFELMSKGLSVDSITLNRPTIYLRRDGDTWSIARLVKKQEQEADRQGPQFPIDIQAIGITDASVIVDDPVGTAGVNIPDRIDRIDAQLSFAYEPVHYSIEISQVSFRASEPSLALNALSGGISLRDDTLYVENLSVNTAESSLHVDGAVKNYLATPDLNLQISSDKLSLPEIARVVTSLEGIALQPAFELKVNGPFDQLGIDMNVRSTAGQLTGQLVADLQDPGQAVRGTVNVRNLDLAPLLKDEAQRSDLTAELRADITADSWSNLDSLRGTARLRAPRALAAGYTAENISADATLDGRRLNLDARASAYGAQATARGLVRVPSGDEPLSFDLRGRASHLNVRALPRTLQLPQAATDLTADYHATGTMPPAAANRRLVADATFADSTLPGARIAAGSTAGVTMQGSALSYRADATVNQLDLQAVGEAFDVPALADARYQTAINAQVTAEGSGTTPAQMHLTASGSLSDSALLGGRVPNLAFTATVADDTAHVTADGAFADFDPAVASGRPDMKGNVGGALQADATIAQLSGGVTADTVTGTVQLTLQPSTIGGLAIDAASLDAGYQAQSADVRTLDIMGRDVNVKAEGTLALSNSGQSQLTFHADSPRLGEIGRLFDVPVEGIAKVDGTITGNRTELQATGTLSADGLKYQDNGALSVDSTYTVTVPDLTFAKAAAEATTKATFVTVAGQNINELNAKTSYADQTVTFDATATQPERSLDAAGSVVLHPDHQEVHLTGLGLTAGQQRWTLATDVTPAITYADATIGIEHLRLQSGSQQIQADGLFGRPGSSLAVSLDNIDLAAVDALLLRPPQFTGRLNATAAVSGTTAAPAVTGQFTVTQGGFRQFAYDTFSGTLSYEPAGVTLDTRLQQNAAQWITAKGFVPSSLFASAPAEPPAAGAAAATPSSDRIDLTIDSSPLDLALVQGFTTEVTDVQGTLEAHVHLAGTASDPQPDGTVRIAEGGMKVAQTGVTYSHIAGDVQLRPDRVHIEQITVLDNHQSALSVTGDLAVRAREVGAFQIWVNAEDFKVLDNEMGNVRIESAMSLAGQLRSPMLQGYLGVTTGEINLDTIIAAFGASPYPTQAPDDAASSAPSAARETAAVPSAAGQPSAAAQDGVGQVPPAGDTAAAPAATPFDALRMNLQLIVPNDLVVKASSLQPPGAAVSLGALNVTLGGDLTATKEPGDSIRLVGPVNTIRGNYDFQGRRFEILRDGTIRFEGLDEIDPSLDIRTRRLIQGVEARVNVRGTLRQPEIVLTSTPPLEQADILSLIVFNQPLNQLGEGQQVSLAQRAQALATGAVAGQLAQSIGNALNLDTFEINVAPENGGGPEVTVGQQLGQDLYVKVQQGIGEQSSTNVVLEYQILQWLRLQTNVLQGSSTQQSVFRRNQGSGVDLIFTFSY